MDWKFMIVWAVFFIAVTYLFIAFGGRMRRIKAEKQKAQMEYLERQKKYSYLKPGILDECPREEVVAAALFHCMRKEDEDFDHYFEQMNHSEKVVYGIYQVTSSLQGQNPSIHSFFLSPATKPYVSIIAEVFEEVGAHELSDLIRAARRFAEIIANDEEDEEDDPEMGDYSRYNFTDFTQEYVALVNSTNLNEKLTEYILAHKNDFYDNEIPSENVEDGDDNDEGISE